MLDDWLSLEPLADLRLMREALRHLMTEGWNGPRDLLPSALASVMVLADMLDTGRALVIQASMPGVKAEDLKVSLAGDRLTLDAEARPDPALDGATYLRRERHSSAFTRTMHLPVGVDGGQAEAVLRDGVLTLTLPKLEGVLPKTIEVKPA